MTDQIDRILREGRPFQLTITVTGQDQETEFILDSDTPTEIGVAEFFKNKALWVAGLKATAGQDVTVEYVKFDDQFVWGFTAQNDGTGLDLSGEADTGNGLTNPSVSNKFGNRFLKVGNKIALKHLAGAGVGASTLILWGVYTERTM